MNTTFRTKVLLTVMRNPGISTWGLHQIVPSREWELVHALAELSHRGLVVETGTALTECGTKFPTWEAPRAA